MPPEMHDSTERFDQVTRAFVDELRMELGCSCQPHVMITWHQLGETPTEGHYHVIAQHDSWCMRVERNQADGS